MGFFKDFKEDLSQAVNELVDEKTATEETDAESHETEDNNAYTIEEEENVADKVEKAEEIKENVEEKELLPSEEVAEIARGTSLLGNIESDGSINIHGKVLGDVVCQGKLLVTGRVTGTSTAGEIFANNAKIEGDLHSSGTIKIGNGAVIIGNVYATSAVIGGAVKGDIDVKGPVIIDGTAVVQGNIKSRSVQINNGAVLEGFCSQCYADIDFKSLFEDTFAIK